MAVLQHRGSPDLVNATAARVLSSRRKTSGLSPVATSDTGSHRDDPRTTPQEAFRLISAVRSISRLVAAFGVINGEIPGGRCAVVRHHGSLDTLANSVWFLYRDWLPASRRDVTGFFRCTSVTSIFVHEVAEHELQTDIICRWPD